MEVKGEDDERLGNYPRRLSQDSAASRRGVPDAGSSRALLSRAGVAIQAAPAQVSQVDYCRAASTSASSTIVARKGRDVLSAASCIASDGPAQQSGLLAGHSNAWPRLHRVANRDSADLPVTDGDNAATVEAGDCGATGQPCHESLFRTGRGHASRLGPEARPGTVPVLDAQVAHSGSVP